MEPLFPDMGFPGAERRYEARSSGTPSDRAANYYSQR